MEGGGGDRKDIRRGGWGEGGDLRSILWEEKEKEGISCIQGFADGDWFHVLVHGCFIGLFSSCTSQLLG